MTITIREVRTSAQKLRFIKFPWKVYREDKNWVPPLIIDRKALLSPKKNPFFKSAEVKLFMAFDQKLGIVGRIAAIVSRNHLKTHNDGAGFFGLFECVNDQQVANALFDKAASFLRSHGMRTMRGPFSMSINDEFGLLVDGFDCPPALLTPHNPAYYQTLIVGYGFRKCIDWYAYRAFDRDGKVPERLRKGVELVKKRYHVTIRSADMKNFGAEVENLKKIYNSAWSQNWGAVPMTDEEFDHLTSDLKLIVDPKYVLFAEVDGQVVGVCLALPDMNQVFKRLRNGRLLPTGLPKLLWYKRKIDALRLVVMGVLKECRHMGVDTCFIYEMWRRALENGIKSCDMSQIVETNANMNNTLVRLGSQRYKTYRLFDCDL